MKRLILLVLLTGCADHAPAPAPVPQVISWEPVLDDRQFIRSIDGIVTNQTSHQFSWIRIEFGCYTLQDSTLLGQAEDSVRNLEPGKVWRFSCPAPQWSRTAKLVRVVGK